MTTATATTAIVTRNTPFKITRQDGAKFSALPLQDGAWLVWPQGLSSRIVGRMFGSFLKARLGADGWVL